MALMRDRITTSRNTANVYDFRDGEYVDGIVESSHKPEFIV